MEQVEGKVLSVLQSIGTEEIITPDQIGSPGEELTEHLFESVGEVSKEHLVPDTILVLKRGIRGGSVQEEAVNALISSGVRAVIGPHFTRLFVRNAANNGLMVLAIPEAADALETGDSIYIDFDSGYLVRTDDDAEFSLPEIPDFLMNLFTRGGVVSSLQQMM